MASKVQYSSEPSLRRRSHCSVTITTAGNSSDHAFRFWALDSLAIESNCLRDCHPQLLEKHGLYQTRATIYQSNLIHTMTVSPNNGYILTKHGIPLKQAQLGSMEDIDSRDRCRMWGRLGLLEQIRASHVGRSDTCRFPLQFGNLNGTN